MDNSDRAAERTRRWVGEVVVGFNLCPFAHRPFNNGQIRYRVCLETDFDAIYRALLQEADTLLSLPVAEAETSLFIIPNALGDFDEYLDMLEVAGEALGEAGLDGILQLASFHPDYQFEGSDPDDPANYTNRSPYPTFHLIREQELEAALVNYPEPEKIPERNVAYLRELGLERVAGILARICEQD